MAKSLDQVGKTFERLTVISRADNDRHGNSRWLCRCQCGCEKIVRGSHQVSGNTQSCGCLDREMVIAMNYKHGMWKTRLYNIWKKMKDRCYNPNANNYRYYGGKGVKVCEEWHSFQPFYEWAMANGYADNLSIDRISGFGNYEPNNCRWATVKEQNNNTSKNVYITIGKETRTVSGWAEETGTHRNTILTRMRNGMSPEAAVLTPCHSRRAV